MTNNEKLVWAAALSPGTVARNKRTKSLVRIEQVTRVTVTYVTLPLLVQWTVPRGGFVKNHKPEEMRRDA